LSRKYSRPRYRETQNIAQQTVLFQMPIEAMIDRLAPLHDSGVTRRVPRHRPSLVFRQGEAARMKAMPPPFRGLRALAPPP
jgi:hypothetical protein